MIRRPAAVILAMAALAACGCGPSDTGPDTGSDTAGRKQLAAKVRELKLDNVALGEAFEFLRAVPGVNIDVRWRAMALEGVERKTIVNVNLKDATVAESLDAILESAEPGRREGPGRCDLGYQIEDGVIVVSSRGDLDSRTVICVYDIRDIIDEAAEREGGSRPRREIIEEIESLVSETVDRDSWRRAGGDAGFIAEMGGRLVVTQNRRNHADIVELLNVLRKSRGLPLAGAGRLRLDDSGSSPIDPAVRKQLDAIVPKLDFDDMELSQAIEFLSEVTGANIDVKWRALAFDAIDQKTAVDVHLSNVTLRKALETVLRQSCFGDERTVLQYGLDFAVVDGAIVVSVRDDLDRHTVTGVYDVRDLTRSIGAGQAEAETQDEILDRLNALIQGAVDPDSWRDVGGETGVVSDLGGRLIITQTVRNHETIGALLDTLAGGGGLQGPVKRIWAVDVDEPVKEVDRAVAKVLDTKAPRLNFKDVRFGDLIQSLHDVSGASIHVNWRALKSEGVDPDTRAGVLVEDMTFGEVLETVLGRASRGYEPGIDKSGLGYFVEDGVITVTSESDLNRRTCVCVYDIGEIAASVQAVEAAADRGLEDDPRTRGEIVDEIKDFVSVAVDSDSWRDAGGEGGAVVELGGQLIVTQTPRNHAKLHGLLNALGRASGVSGSVKRIRVHADPGRPRTEADTAVGKLLDLKIDRMAFEDLELSNAFIFLRDAPGANIHVKWRTLAFENIKPGTPVNAHLKNVTVRKALEIVLTEAGRAGKQWVSGSSGLGYAVKDGVITVSSRSDLCRQTCVRIYDVRDLIAWARGDEEDDMSRREAVGMIRVLITDTVDRDSWRDAGGEAGAVSELGGHLIVTQTRDNQAMILGLLGALRKSAGMSGPVKHFPIDRTDPRPRTKADQPLFKKLLDQPVSKVDFEDMELSQVFDFLRDVSGANVHVNWRALALEGIEPKTTVNLYLKNVTARKLLEAILDDVVSGSEPGVGECGLDYIVDGGVMTVSTKADLDRSVSVCIYDIRDLVAWARGPNGETMSRNEAVDWIGRLIVENIDRDSWRDAGGEAGIVVDVGGHLVITQTRRNHPQIDALLNALRRSAGVKGPVKPLRIDKVRPPAETKADQIVRKQLDTRVAKLDFDDMAFAQVLQFFRDVAGAGTHVRWRVLDAAGVKPDAPVRMRLNNVTFRKALETVFADLSSVSKLGYVIRDGKIVISTDADLRQAPTATFVYDISDMLILCAGPDGGSMSIRDSATHLMRLITHTVDSGSWKVAGGEVGVVRATPLEFTIIQSLVNHEKIVQLLNTLRRAGGVKGPVKRRRIDAPDHPKKAKDAKRLEELIERVRTQESKREFDSAIKTLKQILILDPHNNWAHEHLELLRNFEQLRNRGELIDIRDLPLIHSGSIRRIPRSTVTNYPKDWKEVTDRRDSAETVGATETTKPTEDKATSAPSESEQE